MNHPSDYMNNYQDSFSSDSSNPTIPISTNIKNKPAYSLHQPKTIPPRKPPKPRKNNKKDKVCNSKWEKRRSVSDYLILGDGYYNSKDVKEITRRFMQQQQKESTMVMKIQRLKRKQDKSIAKIQTYIQTFVQNIRINTIIRRLDKQQKYHLYTMLKSQQQQPHSAESIDQFFQCALEKLQSITNTIQNQYPHKNRVISKWKNFKMHQLSTAKSFLSHEVSSEYSCNFENQLEILQQSKFFPELKEGAEDLRFSIMNYLKEQQQRQIRVQDEGVKWVLSRLLKFILETEQILVDFINKIQAITNLECKLLDSNLYILFERQVIGAGQSQQESQQLGYIHIFNKSVFDLVNQSAPFLLTQCEQSNIQGILRYIFSVVTLFEKDQLQDSQILLKIGDILFDFMLQEALQDFLQYL